MRLKLWPNGTFEIDHATPAQTLEVFKGIREDRRANDIPQRIIQALAEGKKITIGEPKQEERTAESPLSGIFPNIIASHHVPKGRVFFIPRNVGKTQSLMEWAEGIVRRDLAAFDSGPLGQPATDDSPGPLESSEFIPHDDGGRRSSPAFDGKDAATIPEPVAYRYFKGSSTFWKVPADGKGDGFIKLNKGWHSTGCKLAGFCQNDGANLDPQWTETDEHGEPLVKPKPVEEVAPFEESVTLPEVGDKLRFKCANFNGCSAAKAGDIVTVQKIETQFANPYFTTTRLDGGGVYYFGANWRDGLEIVEESPAVDPIPEAVAEWGEAFEKAAVTEPGPTIEGFPADVVAEWPLPPNSPGKRWEYLGRGGQPEEVEGPIICCLMEGDRGGPGSHGWQNIAGQCISADANEALHPLHYAREVDVDPQPVEATTPETGEPEPHKQIVAAILDRDAATPGRYEAGFRYFRDKDGEEFKMPLDGGQGFRSWPDGSWRDAVGYSISDFREGTRGTFGLTCPEFFPLPAPEENKPDFRYFRDQHTRQWRITPNGRVEIGPNDAHPDSSWDETGVLPETITGDSDMKEFWPSSPGLLETEQASNAKTAAQELRDALS